MDKNKIDAEIKALQSGFMGNDSFYMGKRNGIEVGYLAAVKKYEAKIERYEKALKAAQVALETCYDVINFPANGETRQDAAIVTINGALSGEGENELCTICNKNPKGDQLTVCDECYQSFDGDRRGFWTSDNYQ